MTKQQEQFLSKAEVIRVATVDAKGMPHVTPVCHVVSRGKIYFAAEHKHTKKVANLRKNPRIALVADVYRSSWRNMGGVMVQGRARILWRGSTFRKVRSLLYRKYKAFSVEPDQKFQEGEVPIIEIIPLKVIDWWF